MVQTLRLILLLSTVFAVYGSLDLCGRCRKNQCMPPLPCKGGLTKDTCGCCDVCLSSEGETCGGINSALGVCNKSLTCVARNPKGQHNRFLPPGFLVGRCEPEECRNVKCGMHQICSVVNGTAKCLCSMNCRNKLDPVCGLSDGKDYRNPCKVKEAECKLQVLIGYSSGYCKGCARKGREYKFGEMTQGSKKCEECTCRHGNWVCSLNLKCLREIVYEGYECTGPSNRHSPIECPDGYRCNITKKGKDGFADRGVCQRLVQGDICGLEADAGPCFGYFVKWYFDSKAGECKHFVYGGCAGNDNRFRTRKGCENICKKGKIPDPLRSTVFNSDIGAKKKRIPRRVKVSGKIIAPKRLEVIPPKSCLVIAVEDVSKVDAPSVIMASQKQHVANFNLTARPLHFAINFLPKDHRARYEVQVVLNIGWCPGKQSKEWVRERDYLTTSSFPIPLNSRENAYSMDVKLEYYGPAPVPVTSLPVPVPTRVLLPEVPEPPFPIDGGLPPPVQFSNETVTISGVITIKKAEIKRFPTPSCMVIKIEDISLMDTSSLMVAKETKNVSGLEIVNNQIEYQITMKKPMAKEFSRTFAVDASISVGWCQYKDKSKKRTGRGDFMTDTNFRVTFTNESNKVKKDFHVIYYCLDGKCEFSEKEKARDPGKDIVSAIKEKTCLDKKTSTRYPLGSEWETEDCLRCGCLPQGTICSPKYCPVLDCRKTKKVKGQCCPVCDEKLQHCIDFLGIKRHIGEKFRGLSDCVRCTCDPDLGLLCGHSLCLDPVCPEGKPVKVPGSCCRVCSNTKICKDEESGELYPEGKIWQRKDCSLAYCSPSGILAVEESDVVKRCPNPPKLQRSCPNVCPQKTVDKIKARLSKEKKEKKPAPTCLDNKTKKRHAVGEHFHPEPCQVCVCGKDLQIKCKPLKCQVNKNCSPAETPKGKCCPVCKSEDKVCVYKEEKYKSGDFFVKDDKCTLCTCKNGKEECSSEFCGTPKGCTHKGKKYVVGEARKADDGCNTCSCSINGMWACTLMACIKPPKTTEQPEAKTTKEPTKAGCSYKDKLYKVGESTKQDCNTCVCGKSGLWGCTKKLCIKIPIKPTGCVHKGKKYAEGEGRKADDGCNTCVCAKNGGWACTLKFCLKPLKTTTAPPKKGCVHNGKKYAEGQGRKDDDGCNFCSCAKDGRWACTLRLCPDPPKTTTAPPKKGCIHKGKKYEIGQNRKADDGCNACFCADSGGWGCTLKLCVEPPKKKSSTITVKKGCAHKGKLYKDGDSRKADDGCNTCTCTGGGWGCTEMACITEPKNMKGCIHKGKLFKDGDSRKADDGCNTCTCTGGSWGCTEMACVTETETRGEP